MATSPTAVLTVSVVSVNSPPDLDLNGGGGGIATTGLFTSGDSATAYMGSATVADDESEPLATLSIVGTGVQNGASEVLTIGGTAYPLNANKTATGTAGGTTFSIAYVTSTQTFTITKSGGGTMPLADVQSLIRAITYYHSSITPTAGDRVFTFVVSDGVDTSTPATLTVTVATAPIILLTNDEEPAISSADKDVAIPVQTTTTAPIDSAMVIDSDGSDVASVTIVGSGIVDAEETLTFGDATLATNSNNSDTTVVLGVTFALSYVAATDTLTITKSGGGNFSLAAITNLLQTMVWANTAVSPTAGDRVFTFTATDAAGATSAESTLTLSVYAPVVIDANGAGGGTNRAVTFTESGSAVTLLDAAGTISGDVKHVLITIDGVISPAYEILEIDGTDFAIGTAVIDDVNVVVGATTFRVQVIPGSPASILLTTDDDSTIPQADMQTLLRSIEYRHTLEGPVEGDRVFTFYPYDENTNVGTSSTTTVTVEQTAPTSTAHTTAQAGAWESPSTWTAGVVPGANDTITMTHHVTANADQTFGHSPNAADATKALLIGSGGKLTIAAGVTIRARGDVQLAANAAQIVWNAGSKLVFDNSLCPDPTTQEYQLIVGASGVTTAELIANGAAGNYATIESYNPSDTYANAYVTFIGTNGGKCRLNYMKFYKLGGPARYGVSIAGPSAGDQIVEFNDCLWDHTGGHYNEYSIPDGDVYRMQRNTFRNSYTPNGTTKTNLCRFYGYSSITTGERTISGCAFDKLVHFQDWGSGDVQNNVFAENYTSGGFSAAWGDITGNVFHWTTTQEPNHFGDLIGNYIIKDQSPTNNNPGFLNLFYMTNCSGNILEDASGVGYQGGGIRLLGNPASPKTFYIENNIMAYNAAGSFGKLIGFHGGANATVYIRNNTTIAGHTGNADGHESGVCCYGETYAGHAGMIAEFVSNLAVRISGVSTPGYLLQQENSAGTPTDVVTFADFNGVYNLSNGSDGMPSGYNRRVMTAAMFTASVPGANDVNADPQFVNLTAGNSAGWDASLGGVGTKANALAELLKINTPEHNTAYTPAALIAFVTNCFRPTNSAFSASGHGGSHIGAVPYEAPAGGGGDIGDASIGSNTDLEQFSYWHSQLLTKGATYAAYLAAHKDDSAPGQPEFENALILSVYYDGERVYRQAASYTGNNAWLTAAADSRHIYNRWMVANGHVLPGYWKFTQGPRMAWEANNSDTQAVDIINGLANFGAFSPDTVPLSSMESEALSREVAYTMNCYMDQELVGGAHRDKLEDLLDLILDTDGHIDQWFVTGPVANFAPFMFGLTCEALIRYYHEQAEDARIIPAIALGANWMWDNAWSDVYNKFPERLNAPYWENGSELSLLICPLYWWLYKQTGNVTYKTRGDIIFNTGMENAFFGVSPQHKQYNQIYRWTPDGLLWRSQGDIIWGAA